jgi:hypothetical protein
MVLVFLTSLILGDTFYNKDCEVKGNWKPYHKTTKGLISCVEEEDSSSFIKFKGDGLNSGYLLGAWEGLYGSWNDREAKTISWDMNYKESYIVYIRIMTRDGARYLYYTAKDRDLGKVNSTMIHHGLGSNTIDGIWHTYTRDLEEDLQDFEPDNKLVAVNAFLIYGSGKIHNITTDSFFKYLNVFHSSSNLNVDIKLIENFDDNKLSIEYGLDKNYGKKVEIDYCYEWEFIHDRCINIEKLKLNSTYHFRIVSEDKVSKDYTFNTLSSNRVVYEDAEDGDTDGWRTKTDSSLIKNLYTEEGNRAIGFRGKIVLGGFKNHANAWHDTTHDIISWDIKTYGVNGGGFVVYVRVMTKNGARYLYYTPVNENYGINHTIKGIHHGLGSDARNDNWHTFSRDLRSDLKDYEPNNKLLAVNGFFITNTNSQFIYVDNIEMYSRENLLYEEYLDNSQMEGFTYTASTAIDKNIPIEKISLGSYSNDKYYNYSYNFAKKVALIDNYKIKYLFDKYIYPNYTYYYRIFYKDGSNSKVREFKTLDSNKTVYWDKESSHWRVYGKDKSRGTVTLGDYYVTFNGDGLNTGYILGGLENDARAWNNTKGNRLSFYLTGATNSFMVYLRVMTKNGARFLCYHSHPKDLGIDHENSSYIHYQLTKVEDKEPLYIINIEDNLRDYEPDNRLVSTNAIIVYGDSTVYKSITIENVKK